jgi:hypothetical protein
LKPIPERNIPAIKDKVSKEIQNNNLVKTVKSDRKKIAVVPIKKVP